MRIAVRAARLADADELGYVHVAAWRAAYPGLVPDQHLRELDPARSAERHREFAAEPDGSVRELVALADGRIAGFALYGTPRDEVPDGWGELMAINLHPDLWGQGVGPPLFAAAGDGLQAMGFRHGYLWVLDGNERAIAFYRRQGWPPDGNTKLDERFDPPLTELRCSAELRH